MELAVFGGDTIAQIKTKVFEQEGITLTALYYSGERHFEDRYTPAIRVQTLLLEGPRILNKVDSWDIFG